ncbi:MAG: hypothetical protein IT332_01615 [Ardenticatenales bacterium]|nr:hypothetical protein [Ardenticatenales bacterium]MCC7018421.1 hypothetical protein [Ardenticatenales bacterium]
MKDDSIHLPNTDDPEVMHRAVAAALVALCWDEVIRTADLDHLDDKAIEVFTRVYEGIGKAFK